MPSANDLPTAATWKLPGDLGRRYGSVSGDFNPIHLHPLSARLFGFTSASVEFAEASSPAGQLRFGVRDAKQGKSHLDGPSASSEIVDQVGWARS